MTLEYTPKGLIPGALISAASVLLLALISAGGHLLRRYREDLEYEQGAEAYKSYVYEDGVQEKTESDSWEADLKHPETEQADPEHSGER